MIKTLNDFDQYINQALQDWNIPGAAVAVVKGDQVLHSGGYGFRDMEQDLPVTENTRFPIASMTKPFTTMGVALLGAGRHWRRAGFCRGRLVWF